jgi:hypothetical protein
VLRSLDLARLLFRDVAVGDDLGVPEESVRIEVHLAIERNQVTLFGHHQRIDLQKAHVLLKEHPIEVGRRRLHLLGSFALKPQREGKLAAVEGLET